MRRGAWCEVTHCLSQRSRDGFSETMSLFWDRFVHLRKQGDTLRGETNDECLLPDPNERNRALGSERQGAEAGERTRLPALLPE